MKKSTKPKKNTKFRSTLALIVVLVSLLVLIYNMGYRYNSTPSYPIGIYKVDTSDHKILRGKLILLCPPDSEFFRESNARGYVAKGFCDSGYEPLIKKIAGIPGDEILIGNYVYINGIKQPKSKVYSIDPQGYRLKHFPKRRYHLKKGEIFLLSDYNEKSFDSRYFGPVKIDLVKGTIIPILTW